MERRLRQRGFTYLELLVSVVILAVLAAAALPLSRVARRRAQELELRRALRIMREAIDRYHDAAAAGRLRDPDLLHPTSLISLVEGAPSAEPQHPPHRFLRKIPVDPFTGRAEWDTVSSTDDPFGPARNRKDVWDVRSQSQERALDGTFYRDW